MTTPAPDPRYGRRDAITVLHAAGQRVAWRWEGHYTLNGKRVTCNQLDDAARQLTDRPFAPAKEPATFHTATRPRRLAAA